MTVNTRKLATGVLVALLAVACLAPVSQGGAAPGARSASAGLLAGVNVEGVGAIPLSYADSAIAQARRLHATAVRTEVPWSSLQPTGPGVISQASQAYLDRLVSDADAAGITVILNVDSSPCWASAAPAALLRKCRPGRPSVAERWPPKNPASFAAFVTYLTERYGQDLTAIEIWNEPDQANELYFAGPHKAARYAAVLRAAYTAIKLVNPHTMVLAGSLVGPNGVFLRALYAAGIKGYYDALAVHFYTLTVASLRSIHEVQLANGDHTPLWLDEFGWSSCWPRHKIDHEQACVTPAVQAQNIRSIFGQLSRMPYVAAAVIYKLESGAQEEFGMLAAGGRAKPAFSALASALASTPAIPSPSLSLTRRGASVVAAGSGPVGDFMTLEAFKAGALRYRAYFVLNRFNKFSIALPSVLGTSGLSVRVYQYGVGPASAAQRSV